MKIGCIVRLDRSGLSNQSRCVASHLNLDLALHATVAIDMGWRSRGPQTQWKRPTTLRPEPVCPDDPPHHTVEDALAALDGCDVVWTAESWYWPDLPQRLAERGTRTVCHVNPELYQARDHRQATAVLPTDWHAERLRLPVVPHPAPIEALHDIAVARLAEPAAPARRFLHVAAPAMEDRNGTNAVLAACALYDGPPIEVVIAGEGVEHYDYESYPNVTITAAAPVDDWRELYTLGDVLVLPRRYGGQCLPALEAAAAAMPVIMPALEPQLGWSGVDARIGVVSAQPTAMRGGRFPVHQLDAASLAILMAEYATSASLTAHRSLDAHQWAQSLSWANVAPLWRAVLAGAYEA